MTIIKCPSCKTEIDTETGQAKFKKETTKSKPPAGGTPPAAPAQSSKQPQPKKGAFLDDPALA
jgi:hypothetical protein